MVRKLLKENGYPKKFISEVIESRVNGFYNGKDKNTNNKPSKYIPTLNAPGLSEQNDEKIQHGIGMQNKQQCWQLVHKDQITDAKKHEVKSGVQSRLYELPSQISRPNETENRTKNDWT